MNPGTVIAVTGDVGAGKSSVASFFESLGGFLIDADRVVAELWRRPEVVRAATERWGPRILDDAGRVSHTAVAKIIFFDTREYAWATGLLHPLVYEEIGARLDRLDRTKEWAVVEIPLLFEAGPAPWVSFTVFVTATREIRAARCRARGWDEAELAKRERFFMDSETRMGLSDFVIHNDGTREDLLAAVKGIIKEIAKGTVPDATDNQSSQHGF